eukprot:symbB.v1.2.029935.t1/scaffold3324.1/size59041/3
MTWVLTCLDDKLRQKRGLRRLNVPFILENPQIRDISNACSDVKRTSNVMGLFPEIGALQATEGSHRCCH